MNVRGGKQLIFSRQAGIVSKSQDGLVGPIVKLNVSFCGVNSPTFNIDVSWEESSGKIQKQRFLEQSSLRLAVLSRLLGFQLTRL